MNHNDVSARLLACIQSLIAYGVTVEGATTEDGFLVLHGRNATTQIVGVVCSSDLLSHFSTPHRLRLIYHRLQNPLQRFVLLTEPGREADAQSVLNEVIRADVFPALPPQYR